MIDLATLVRNVPDFPKLGIQFKDVTTLLKSGPAFRQIIDGWRIRYEGLNVDAIVGAEARGFIFGAALAYAMEKPFVPVRKPGKLPADVLTEEFCLEYGTDTLQIHRDALSEGDRVVLVDDLLATGGTMCAIVNLVRRLGAQIVEAAFVIDLPLLNGRQKLEAMGVSVHSLIEFMVE